MIYIHKFDNAITFKLKSISLFWYLDKFLEKDKSGSNKHCMINVYRADQLKRFTPFSYLNHSFILSLNVEVFIRFIVFLQISLFFIC